MFILEGCVSAHFNRKFPTYYIKAEGEIDVAYVKGARFWPIEVRWTGQLRKKDLKQILKYPNACIWSKVNSISHIESIPVKPVPLALYQEFD